MYAKTLFIKPLLENIYRFPYLTAVVAVSIVGEKLELDLKGLPTKERVGTTAVSTNALILYFP